MRFRGGEFSTGTMGNFQPELTRKRLSLEVLRRPCRFKLQRPERASTQDGDPPQIT